MLKRKPGFTGLISLCLLLTLAISAGAQNKQNSDPPAASNDKSDSEEAKRANEAAEVLTEIMAIPEKAIPDKLMENAEGIAVIPHVVKGAFLIGGQWGKGVIAQRMDDGTWSAPSYIEVGGGSYGLQIGVEATDIVLVFTNESGIRDLLKSKVKIGADASATAGPVGRRANIGTDVLLQSGIFSYSRSKGLFAGVSLDGSVVGIDDSANEKVYGKEMSAEKILFSDMEPKTEALRNFVSTLTRVSPASSSGDSKNKPDSK